MNFTPLSFFLSMVGQNRGRYFLILAFELLQAVSGIFAPLVFGLFMGEVSKLGESKMNHIVLVVAFAILILMDMLFSRFSGGIFVRTLGRQRHWVVQWLFERVLTYPRDFYLKQSPGLISHRISETSVAVNQILGCIIFDFWPMLVALSAATILLFVASPWLGAFMLAWLAIFILASFIFAKKGSDFASNATGRENETNGHIADSLGNHLIVTLFNGFARESRNLSTMLTCEIDSISRANRYFETVRWSQFIAMPTLVVVVVVGSFILFECGEMEIALLTMAMGLVVNIVNYTLNLSQRFADFFGFWGRLSDGVSGLLRQRSVEDCTCAHHEPMRDTDIRLESVEFSYDNDRPIVADLCLHIPAGQKVGIVGASGAGKSTILGLLLNLHKPRSGRIYFGGKPIDQICPKLLRENISVIPQESLLFDRSISDNIGYGSGVVDRHAMRSAAKLADADRFIEALPDAYDTIIGCDGGRLSGGERQRVAIARALVKDAPVLIVDEATANLDPLAEQAIRDALLSLATAKTVLVVAHRLRMVAPLDRIVVLDQGLVVEDGTHEALLERNGLYRELWDSQSD